MTFELLPSISPFLVGFFVLAAIGAVTSVAVFASVATNLVRVHRPLRRARNLSVPAYYGRMITTH